MGKEKKPKAPKAPASVEKLIGNALRVALNKPSAKWLGKGPSALFNEKEPNTELAIAQCLDSNRPLLKKEGDGGTLTPAGLNGSRKN